MGLQHNGFTFRCDCRTCERSFVAAGARTRRTAIVHAQLAHWFVGYVSVPVPKFMRSERVHRVVCDHCKWILGVRG
jgi:hypothetical protein